MIDRVPATVRFILGAPGQRAACRAMTLLLSMPNAERLGTQSLGGMLVHGSWCPVGVPSTAAVAAQLCTKGVGATLIPNAWPCITMWKFPRQHKMQRIGRH